MKQANIVAIILTILVFNGIAIEVTYSQLAKHFDERIFEQIEKRFIAGRFEERVDERVDGRFEERVDERVDERLSTVLIDEIEPYVDVEIFLWSKIHIGDDGSLYYDKSEDCDSSCGLRGEAWQFDT